MLAITCNAVQCMYAHSGASLCREDEYLVNMQHTVIPSWFQREGYVQSMANLIQEELKKFEEPDKVCTVPSLSLLLGNCPDQTGLATRSRQNLVICVKC